MKLTCNQCGAAIQLPEDIRFLTCDECGTNLQVERSGEYRVALYGWPKGSDAAMNAKFKGIAGRAVAGARLKVGEREMTADAAPDDMCVTFTVRLTKGDRPRLQSWFRDAGGKDLGGAYFVYVDRM